MSASIFDNFTGWTVLGIILVLLASFSQTLALCLMKVLHNRNVRLPQEKQRPYFKTPFWWLCLVLLVCGVVMDVFALSFLPSSLAMPLGGTGLALNAAFSAIFLKEKFTRWDLIGTISVILGCWVAILFSNKPPLSNPWTAQRLLHNLIPNQLSGIYVIALLILDIALWLITRKVKNISLLSIALPGSIAAFVNLGGKGVAEMFKATAQGQNQFVEWFLYIWLLAIVPAVIIQNHYLQAAMSRFDQVIVAPVYWICLCIFAVLNGVCFYGEWLASVWWQNMLFVIGVLIIFTGTGLITKGHLRSSLPPTPDTSHTTHTEIKDLPSSSTTNNMDDQAEQGTLSYTQVTPLEASTPGSAREMTEFTPEPDMVVRTGGELDGSEAPLHQAGTPLMHRVVCTSPQPTTTTTTTTTAIPPLPIRPPLESPQESPSIASKRPLLSSFYTHTGEVDTSIDIDSDSTPTSTQPISVLGLVGSGVEHQGSHGEEMCFMVSHRSLVGRLTQEEEEGPHLENVEESALPLEELENTQ